MISGGDMAMMSPVVRIRMPFSKALRKAEKARLVGCAGDRLELDRADQAEVADVDDMRQALQANAARPPSSRRVSAPRVSRPSSSIDVERGEAGRATATGLPE